MKKSEFIKRFQTKLNDLQNQLKTAYDDEFNRTYFSCNFTVMPLKEVLDQAIAESGDESRTNRLSSTLNIALARLIQQWDHVENAYVSNGKLYVELHKPENDAVGKLARAFNEHGIQYYQDDDLLVVQTGDKDKQYLFLVKSDEVDNNYINVEFNQQCKNQIYDKELNTDLIRQEDINYFITALNIAKQFMKHQVD